MHATAKDLRFHSKELLNTVKRGEEVIISYHGKSCAKLIPIEEEWDKNISDKDELFGIWSDNEITQDVKEYSRSIRKGRLNAN